jgi:TPR repeat protein
MSDDQIHRPAEPLQSGLELLFSGSPHAEAFARLRAAAESGDAQGQFLTGMLYYLGKGTDKDLRQAVLWLTRAAEQGHADAQYELAQRYTWGEGTARDLEAAARWNRKAAAQRHPAALAELGGLASSN